MHLLSNMYFHIWVFSWQKITGIAATDRLPLMWDCLWSSTFSNSLCGNVMQIICKCEILKSKATLTVLIAKVCSIIYNPSKDELEINCFCAVPTCSRNVNSTTFWIIWTLDCFIKCCICVLWNRCLTDIKHHMYMLHILKFLLFILNMTIRCCVGTIFAFL